MVNKPLVVPLSNCLRNFSSMAVTEKKNYLQLQIHFHQFHLNFDDFARLTSHSPIWSKLLKPLTCCVFNKVSKEEDRTLRLKRPSQGPSLADQGPSPHEFIWVLNQKYGWVVFTPQIIHLFIIFTIHFGVPLLLETPIWLNWNTPRFPSFQ